MLWKLLIAVAGPLSLWLLGAISGWLCLIIGICSIVAVVKTNTTPLPALYDGTVEPGWEKVRDVFQNLIESGMEQGGAFSVYHEGRLVVDLWGGYSDLDAERPWTRDTLAVFFSATKGMCAICIAHLHDKGVLDYHAPVMKYWPEFAQNGKASITVEMIMSHQAGLVIMDEPFRLGLISEDPDELGRILAETTPNWTPGTAHGYHILSIGLYVDQIIRRVDPQRRDLKQYFQEEVSDKIGAEYHIGLSMDLTHRCVRLKPGEFGVKYLFHTKIPGIIKMLALFIKSSFNGNNLLSKFDGNILDWKPLNNYEFRTHPIGSSHGFSTARDIAKIYSALVDGSQVEGEEFLKPETVQYLGTPLCSGPDKLLMKDVTWGPGMFCVKHEAPHNPPERYTFGHPGLGAQFGMCDPHYKLAYGYCNNFTNDLFLVVPDHRHEALTQAMYECARALAKDK